MKPSWAASAMRSDLTLMVRTMPVTAWSEPSTVSKASNMGSLSSWRSLS